MYFRNANKRYRAPLPGHDPSASLRFTFLVYPPSLRATTTIYIVTGGAVLYSPFISPGQISDGRNFTGEFPHAKYPRARGTRWSAFSRVHPVVTTPRNRSAEPTRLSSKNLHVRDRPILAGRRIRSRLSVPDLRNSSCGRRTPGRRQLFTYEEAAVEGGGRL